MNAPRLHILTLLLVTVCLRAAWAQEAATAPAAEAVPATQIEAQLRIYKTTLLENQSAKNRVDAAILLLASDKPQARAILLDVLSRADNPLARAAICEALSPAPNSARTWQQPIKDKEDFIKPLIGVITSEQDFAIVKLAAEATLMFGYSQVQMELEKAVVDPSLSVAARINVIYAIRRHPDKQAVIKLFTLMDSPEPQIVAAAKDALSAVGIFVSSDPAARAQMLQDLQKRDAGAFLRERVIRQETRMRENETERETLWKKYLADKTALYNLQGTEAAKVKYLGTALGDRDVRVKLWALDRLEELRVGTNKAKFSELEPALILLISDPSRDVRLSTAKRLAALWELNVAKPLLDQLNVESDEQVRREILVALRETCYASLTTPGARVPEEIRVGTLAWAVKFLDEDDPEKARTGAEVIGKLLEPNGMKAEDMAGYLKALADRYARLDPANDVGLRGYLLSAMSGLCSARSACRELAAKYFGAFFEQALADKSELVRQIAFDGVVNVNSDKASALRRLRKDLGADPVPAIRVKLIDLTGEAGGPQDLDWLADKLGVPVEGEPAWQAMLKIFRQSGVAVLADWTVKIKSPALAAKLSPEQRITFFSLVEQTAQRESKADLVRDAQGNLADLYVATGSLKQASESLKVLLAAGLTGPELGRRQGQLLQVYLGLNNVKEACALLTEYLPTKDLDLSPEGSVAKCIEAYLSNPATVNPDELLKSLEQIQVSDPAVQQVWRTLLSGWTERYAKAKKSEESDRTNN